MFYERLRLIHSTEIHLTRSDRKMEEYNDFTDGIVEHKSRMSESIRQFGLYVHQDENCCYTVGMSLVNFPELVLFNQSLETASEIFVDILQCVKQDKIVSIKDYIDNNPFSRVSGFLALAYETKRSILWSARLFHDTWDFDARLLQIDGGS